MDLSGIEKDLHDALRAIEPQSFQTLQDLWDFLKVSEQMLQDVLDGKPENPELAGRGDPELGHFLHYLHHPHDDLLALLEGEPIAQAAWALLTHAAKPDTALEQGYFDGLKASAETWPIVGPTGVLYGLDQYEALDVRWAGTFINIAITFVTGAHAFGAAPYTAELKAGPDGTVRLGLVGDWGTGIYGEDAGTAVAIMKQLAGLSPDYLFHLGDVYYSGTGAAPFVPSGQETGNFTGLWPQPPAPGRSFALNGNHDMYSGAHGFFPVILADPAFGHQNKTSYFGLTFGKWVILGLDTAYHALVNSMYMNGVLGAEQTAWIEKFGKDIGGFDGRKILVLTHHDGQTLDGSATLPLYDELRAALGRAPDVWYWGHKHNGIAYSMGSAAGRLGTRACCIGHGAIPFGAAQELLNDGKPIASAEYVAQTPSPAGSNRVLNGFATLELGADGSIREAMYEQGNPKPVWTR